MVVVCRLARLESTGELIASLVAVPFVDGVEDGCALPTVRLTDLGRYLIPSHQTQLAASLGRSLEGLDIVMVLECPIVIQIDELTLRGEDILA